MIIIYVICISESIDGNNYTYTTGIDAEDTFLFCNTEDSSVQLSNIYWKRKDGLGYYTNPLDVYTLRDILILTNNREMECFDTESGDNIMRVGLYLQGLYNVGMLHIYILRSFALTAKAQLGSLVVNPLGTKNLVHNMGTSY